MSSHYFIFSILLVASVLHAAPTKKKPSPKLRGEEVSILPEPNLKCGDYWGQGNMRINNQGEYVLTFNERSSSPTEIITLGGKIKEKQAKVGTKVALEFYVPKPISSNQAPYVFFQKFIPVVHESEKDFVRRLQVKPCKDMARFHQ